MSVSMTEMREPNKARSPARDEERWQAVQRRDPAFDGKFFFAVRTTGIYCRPSCASRPARRENVSFFLTVAEAEKAGYRACKRCRPDRLGAPIRKSTRSGGRANGSNRLRRRRSSPSSRWARA